MIYVKFRNAYIDLSKPHVLLGAPAARATLDALGPPLVRVMSRQFPPKLFEAGVPLLDKRRIRALKLVAEIRPIGMREQSDFEDATRRGVPDRQSFGTDPRLCEIGCRNPKECCATCSR